MLNNKKLTNILNYINVNLYEREEAVSVILLCMIAKKSVFLYGPPGTGKSYIARRVASVFESNKFFDYLMGKFSTPEEIFGPVKLSELKHDNLERDIAGFLPSADFAFLDEIWKSSPAILNSLLTILNEKIFKNGKTTIDVPLKGLISASNEFPQANQGLEALYDRFLVRLEILPISNKDNFKNFLQNENTANLDEKITNSEIDGVVKKAKTLAIDEKVLDILEIFRNNINIYNNENKENAIYISDRKYKMIFELIKVMAVLCGREKVEIADLILLEYCAWDKLEQREIIKKSLEDAIKDFSIDIDFDFVKINDLKKTIDCEIKYQKEAFSYVTVDDKEYIYFNKDMKTYWSNSPKTISIYVQKESLYKNNFQEVYYEDTDDCLAKLYDFRYIYEDESHKIYYGDVARNNGYDYANSYKHDNMNGAKHLTSVVPKYKKGDYKEISSYMQQTFVKALKDCIDDIENHLQKCEEEKEKFIKTMNNLFFDKTKFDMYFKALEDTKSNLESKQIECEKYIQILEEEARIKN